MDHKAPVQFVLVRKDMPWNIQAVQVGHACGESIRVAPIPQSTIIRLLHVADEAELRDYATRITEKGYHGVLVVENGGPFEGQAVSFAVEPLTERTSGLAKLVWHLKRAE